MMRHVLAALSGIALALGSILGGVLMAPGEWFVRYELAVVPGPDAPRVVVQTRRPLMDMTYTAQWVADVDRITADGVEGVCHGEGRSVYARDARPFIAPLPRWVNDPECDARLRVGQTYQASATWTFHVFGTVKKQTSAVSAPFVVQ